MTNLYHILDKEAKLHGEDLPIELEELATRLVASGLVRIDAYNQINFGRFSIPDQGFSTMISNRQLLDENLLPTTLECIRKEFSKRFKGLELEKKVNNTVITLKQEIKKYLPISYSMEKKIARIIVQTTHPVVLELVMLEKVQVFFSYSYNIGDVLDIPTWQEAGSNSGMQSTDGKNTAIYVSCGGDPLLKEKEVKEDKNGPPQDEITYGSGKPAMARAIIIGGQEFGHYSDIIRDDYGRYVGRHSAIYGGRRASAHVKKGRIEDISHVQVIKKTAILLGLNNITEAERHVKFYRKHKVNNLRSLFSFFITAIRRAFFFARINKNNLSMFNKFKKDLYPATSIINMLDDMAFNLAPEADVYKNPDKNIEEAIACIEALARVPQQCNKWGYQMTQFIYPNLYKIFNP